MIAIRILRAAWGLLPSLTRILPYLSLIAVGVAGYWAYDALLEAEAAIERQERLHAAEMDALRADIRAAEAWRQSFERLEFRIGEIEAEPLTPAFSAYRDFILVEQAQ